MLIHSVYFWLKQEINDEEKIFFFNEVNKLSKIQSVSGFYCGGPAPTPKRPVVEDSYDCGLTVVLNDLDGHDIYQADPIHLEFIEKCSSLWEKVQIYDSEHPHSS